MILMQCKKELKEQEIQPKRKENFRSLNYFYELHNSERFAWKRNYLANQLVDQFVDENLMIVDPAFGTTTLGSIYLPPTAATWL